MNAQSQQQSDQPEPQSVLPRPKIVLLEDRPELREGYTQSLEKAGFDVRPGVDGNELEKLLTPDVAVILSDTDMPVMDSPNAVEQMLDRGILSDSVLVLAMSDEESNAEKWRGIAHHAGFFNKNRFLSGDIGYRVMSHFRNFSNSNSLLWRMRML
jgi:CheY-like chemotaxis protein